MIRSTSFASAALWGLALSGLLGLALGACGDAKRSGGGGDDDDDGIGDPCESDSECKGDRICVQGTCVDPGTGSGTTTISGSSTGTYDDEIAATCSQLQSLGCADPSFASYEECVAAFEQAFATCGDQADLPSYMACLQTYSTCDPETGELVAYECFGVGLNVSWCFGGGTGGGGMGGSGVGGSGVGGSGSGGFDGGSGGSGSGGFDGGA